MESVIQETPQHIALQMIRAGVQAIVGHEYTRLCWRFPIGVLYDARISDDVPPAIYLAIGQTEMLRVTFLPDELLHPVSAMERVAGELDKWFDRWLRAGYRQN